jgi:hypothetical protein
MPLFCIRDSRIANKTLNDWDLMTYGRSAWMVDKILVCNQLRARCVSAVCLLGRVEEVRFPPSDPRCEDVGSAHQRKARPLQADTPFVTLPSKHTLKDCCRGLCSTLMLMFNMS